ncbi:DUF4430 domain-containing protein [Clostridium niameyense]|uniref:DUF4430 domain-containing protein n=1 Tax=Clostridium niameyense TaxID=1622073 RepID=A0A6M0R9W6_9CLOT|nr:DUF4430 domain-containing protein [Clostridium niameyense]NEZ46399.1 DUF4430 domain-containing protein [Clostridium niameyense]
MKKKIVLSLMVILISIGTILGAKSVEKSMINPNDNNRQISTQRKNTTVKDKNEKKQENKENNNLNSTQENKSSKKSNKTSTNTQPKQKSDNVSKENNNSKEKSSPQSKNNNNISENKTQTPNILIQDETTGKTITSTYIDFSNNPSVGEVTIKVMQGRYEATGYGDNIYFSSIAGINEKSKGPLSGWCYYVNGVKASKSAGAYKLKAGDSLIWKFVKDGVNN